MNRQLILPTFAIVATAVVSFGLSALASNDNSFKPATTAPPNGNAYAPLDVGPVANQKQGGLVLGTGGVATGLVVQSGNVGIDTASPTKVLDVNGSEIIEGTNKLGTYGKDPDSGYPSGWGGGVHTWDVYAEGTVGAGPSGGPAKAYFNNAGTVSGSQMCLGGNCISSWPGAGSLPTLTFVPWVSGQWGDLSNDNTWHTYTLPSGATNASAAYILFRDDQYNENGTITVYANPTAPSDTNQIEVYGDGGGGHNTSPNGSAMVLVPVVQSGSNYVVYLKSTGNTNVAAFLTSYMSGFATTPPAPVATMSVNPPNGCRGDSTTVSWTSYNTSSCTGSWASGSVGTNGSFDDTLTGSAKTYTLTCTGTNGSSVSSSVTVPAGSTASYCSN